MSLTLASWVAFVTGVVGCYFTAVNYALLNLSRVRLAEVFAERGRPGGMERLDAYRDRLLLATALVRATMNLLILVTMLAVFVPPGEAHDWTEMAAALVCAAVVIAVAGVAIPLSWARHAGESLVAASLGPLIVLTRVLYPVMAALRLFDPVIRRLLGVPREAEGDTAPVEQEILHAVSEGERSGAVDEEQKEMIEAVVSFPAKTVDQVMTPRTDIEGIPVEATLEKVKAFVAAAGHSRAPVFDGDLDHIVGVLYAKDLISLLGEPPESRPFDLRRLVREALFVPETKTLRDLLTQFKHQKVHIAIVLDEYGGTAGLVTIEDIFEELVGEIRDEHEKPSDERPQVQRIDDRTFEAHGRAYVEELNNELGLGLPDDEDYDTLGGFVFATLGRVPDKGDTFEFENLVFTITDAEKTRVNSVRIEVSERDEQGVEEPMD